MLFEYLYIHLHVNNQLHVHHHAMHPRCKILFARLHYENYEHNKNYNH